MQQLRLFELVISQAKQPLLMHRPVMKPLLRLLIDVADSHGETLTHNPYICICKGLYILRVYMYVCFSCLVK